MKDSSTAVMDLTLTGGHASGDGKGPFVMSITTPHQEVDFVLDNQMPADVTVQLSGEGQEYSLKIDGKEVSSGHAAKEPGVERKNVSVRVTPCPHGCHAEVILLVPAVWERCTNAVQVAPREMLLLVVTGSGYGSLADALFGMGGGFFPPSFGQRRSTNAKPIEEKKS
ncbi:hypothetical protein COU78_04770 [Candidatus Peregrinibacteria bacterium CG10_big_fil_rev_8_21_14_0_10_49_24]|nr:MAG: hypothetical protein COV83_03915 [Candidatus Peregrinibacteria bacterium CG11_big_fil_rev_8_21_14_0_20_49_14]PIR50664.1 MAG: hypothetical protein COU78_04770 [Candidatus Peregrinibacteria bacterium CG10_big_fil_rev_8_21_14_0_10_49_24]PJA67748.1 MAG: hypothetical protein CO157_03060 [Candidatus Peregrinibacteria bacterium CG_4_9_14_3_um_filter_49_12]